MAQTSYAASSSSPSTSYAQFQVFINHRGPDVKNTFASHLYHRLNSIGVQVFLDKPELVEGCTFPSQIEAAIQSAAIHIAIFSPTYAQSQWCLDELVHMIKSEGTIIPVFYNVKPCDLRRTGKDGNGTYAQALRQHEDKERYNSQTIQNWREALFTAANISGFELQAFEGDEGQLLEKVVGRVLNEVDRTPLKFVAEHPTGLKEQLEEFESKVLQGRKKKVVAIVGPGGVGKTTLAKEYFSQRRSHYRRSCILYDVRENAVNGCLPSLQRKLLKDLTGLDLQIDNIHDGIEKLMKHLYSSSSQFLLILDDVDDAGQLEPFWPIKDIDSSKSLILITSRDKKILKTAQFAAKIAETAIYELKGLNVQHSKELFCRHAFKQPHPPPEFADLVAKFLIACNGLPLSLKVFGALVCGEYDKSYWAEKLNGLNNILPMAIQKRLKLSYDSLSSKDQEIFLDIACFFIGTERDTVIRICGSVGDLENKCLLEFDKGKIKMHDQIRDMGRSIAENVSPRRFWDQTTKNMDHLLEQLSCGNIEVRGVKMKVVEENTSVMMSKRSWYNRLSDEVFKNSRRPFDYFGFCGILNLQFVEAEDGYLEQIVRRARAPHLQTICWHNCTHSSLPSWIPMENLKVLEVHGRKLRTLWKSGCQVPRQLRQLLIDAPLSGFPKSMGLLEHLECIGIWNAQFKTLPREVCDVYSLKYLHLFGCSQMISLSDSLAELTNLDILSTVKCGIEYFPEYQMNNPKTLWVEECPLVELSFSFGSKVSRLQELYLRKCKELRRIKLSDVPTLKCVFVEGCENLEELSVGYLISLHRLEVDGCAKLERIGGLGQLGGQLWQEYRRLYLGLRDCPEIAELAGMEHSTTSLTCNFVDCPKLERWISSYRYLDTPFLTTKCCLHLK